MLHHAAATRLIVVDDLEPWALPTAIQMTSLRD